MLDCNKGTCKQTRHAHDEHRVEYVIELITVLA